ncbi:hypothetical protein AKJ37_06075 [candidate division MSBL1 archaeon SCGC-AAA259I09]|uniref:DUF2283 domain-containing protein n=2 Tax=candidate division MSBL1 TaxID=215777 RepID=A0A133UPG6_9EURY|nr:hypothetical protein AKJ37_06075 [candidate division MSBL1 archaeon SCGC-AAA259I09]KXA97145.1 hypothetical protein AKJ39_03640 [candidate division MSBL1 archaeon SCGC-AAA259J03]
MKINYDSEINALNIRFQEGNYEKSIEVAGGIIVDYTADKKIMSIEILDANEKIPLETIRSVQKAKSAA